MKFNKALIEKYCFNQTVSIRFKFINNLLIYFAATVRALSYIIAFSLSGSDNNGSISISEV